MSCAIAELQCWFCNLHTTETHPKLPLCPHWNLTDLGFRWDSCLCKPAKFVLTQHFKAKVPFDFARISSSKVTARCQTMALIASACDTLSWAMNPATWLSANAMPGQVTFDACNNISTVLLQFHACWSLSFIHLDKIPVVQLMVLACHLISILSSSWWLQWSFQLNPFESCFFTYKVNLQQQFQDIQWNHPQFSDHILQYSVVWQNLNIRLTRSRSNVSIINAWCHEQTWLMKQTLIVWTFVKS